ncbi:MAG: UvrD-helicase domain-containing protein [Rikenellaceae bacterium]
MSKFATEEEIRRAHSILLDGKPFFDDKKLKIIECNETVDVKACPGSGKTTTLLAKLIVLANRMPLPNNQGICVLTHTNVAMDEIKSKLGHNADVLFSYPNFFGTIQSFVNKFLAMPYWYSTYQTPIQTIDDNIARFIMLKEYRSLSFNDRKIFFNEIKDRIDKRLKGKDRNTQIDREIFKFIHNTAIGFTDRKITFFRISGATKPYVKDSSKQTYKALAKVRLGALRQGVLKYDDAFSLAQSNLHVQPQLIKAITHRFKYLFIDEMQDTDEIQKDIINKVFKESIAQCFGDQYQAIYNNKVKTDMVWNPTIYLPINNSMRFGANIAEVLKTVCIEDNHDIVGNSSVESLKPILIVYNDASKVIPEYAKLIKTRIVGDKTILEIANEEKCKDQLHRVNLKAIGWVGKDDPSSTKTTINSYFPNFNKNIRKRDKVKIDSFRTYMRKRQFSTIKEYLDLIIRSIIHVLSLSETSRNEVNGKYRCYTKTTFLSKLQADNENLYLQFKTNLANWSRRIHTSESIYNDEVISEVKSFIVSITEMFSITTSDEIQAFIDNTQEDITSDESSSNNIYADDNVEIEINNIHSVKGETHIATLYMETSYHTKCESERIHEQLKGIAYSGDKTYNQETLKMAYVAMSRPRYMLCMAIHSSHFNFRCAELESRWEIIEI